MNMNVEYRHITNFENFFKKTAGKTVAVMYDVNTKPYALPMIKELEESGAKTVAVYYTDEELVPSEDKCEYAYERAKNTDYVLAVGSGTLNDMAKSVSTRLDLPCGVLATAASMTLSNVIKATRSRLVLAPLYLPERASRSPRAMPRAETLAINTSIVLFFGGAMWGCPLSFYHISGKKSIASTRVRYDGSFAERRG